MSLICSCFSVSHDASPVPPQAEKRCACRGAYRASAGKWFHPEKLTPPGTQSDPHNSRAKLSKLQEAGGAPASCADSLWHSHAAPASAGQCMHWPQVFDRNLIDSQLHGLCLPATKSPATAGCNWL